MSAAACAKIIINAEAGMAIDLAVLEVGDFARNAHKLKYSRVKYRYGVEVFHGVLEDMAYDGAITSDTRDGWLLRAVQQDEKITHGAEEPGGLEAATVEAVARWFWKAARELAGL